MGRQLSEERSKCVMSVNEMCTRQVQNKLLSNVLPQRLIGKFDEETILFEHGYPSNFDNIIAQPSCYAVTR